MKKLFLILFLLISICSSGQRHIIGVQGGINITHITSQNTFYDIRNRNGIIAGICYEISYPYSYSFEINLLYSQQGFTVKFIDEINRFEGEYIDAKYYLDYIKLPLKLGYKFGNRYKITPRLGVCPSVLLNAKEVLYTLSDKQTTNFKSNVRRYDFAELFEVEVSYSTSNGLKIYSLIQVMQGILTISNSNFYKESKMRNFGYSFSLGLKYYL